MESIRSRGSRLVVLRVKTWDPMVFVSVPVLLALGRIPHVWFPAGRASRADPVIELRA